MFLSVRTSWWGESPKEILSRTTAFYQGILPRVLNSKSSFCSPSTLLPLPTLLVQNGKLPVSVLADIFCRNAWRQLRKPEASHAFFRFDRRRKHCGSHQNEPRPASPVRGPLGVKACAFDLQFSVMCAFPTRPWLTLPDIHAPTACNWACNAVNVPVQSSLRSADLFGVGRPLASFCLFIRIMRCLNKSVCM